MHQLSSLVLEYILLTLCWLLSWENFYIECSLLYEIISHKTTGSEANPFEFSLQKKGKLQVAALAENLLSSEIWQDSSA